MFHWFKNDNPSVNEINRFTRILFGLAQLLFILKGTLKENYINHKYQNTTETIKNDIDIDIVNLNSGGCILSIELFLKRRFNLHK